LPLQIFCSAAAEEEGGGGAPGFIAKQALKSGDIKPVFVRQVVLFAYLLAETNDFTFYGHW
jgi:hypothetical protein